MIQKIQQIQPTQVGNKTADQIVVNLNTSAMTETQCEMFCYLVDTTQTSTYVSKNNTNETLPYTLLKGNKHILTGNDLDLVKQDENNVLNIVANIFNVTLI
jgi:hypothetical protein